MKTELRHMSQSLFSVLLQQGYGCGWQHCGVGSTGRSGNRQRGETRGQRGGLRPACACLLCHSLLKLRKARPDQRWVGAAGMDSRKYHICGEAGAELTIPVPTGTTVWLEQHQKLLGTHCEAGTEAVGRCGSGGLP
ncbi:uncharacterized protein LOC135097463 isoform X3 [Scylla paramamosain]|uniref:uncharacterized protein LOC135097463 isoform X3 n=1 Tax=Scylla paramamosain TaxID=85552 RepID=UPI003082BF73